MDPKAITFLTAALCILSLQPFIITKADEALIGRLCNATSAPAVCSSCLKSDPSSATETDVGLTEICMVCAANDMDQLFQDTFRYQEKTTEPKMKDALNYCLDRFEDAKAKINAVSDKVQSRDFDGAKGIISDQVLGQVVSCTSAIQSKGLQVPEVVSDGIASATRDWNIVLGILGSIK